MSSETMSANTFAGGDSFGNVRGWIIFAGITSLVVGTAAVIYTGTATIASVVLFGWLLMVAGVMQTVNAFQVRTWSGFFLYLLDGIIRTVVGALVVIVVIAGRSPQASADDSREKQMKDAASQSAKAAKAFDGIMQVPDKAIPRELIAQAKAIAVFPQVIKVAFAAGGGGGRGVVSLHIGDTWGEPVFFRAGGGSVGPQMGASSTDFVLLLLANASCKALIKDKFELEP